MLQVSVALGCATNGRTIAFASTFAAFLTRAFDQIRMGAISQININFIGSHCGISIGMSSECHHLDSFLLQRKISV
jgi:transketolase